MKSKNFYKNIKRRFISSNLTQMELSKKTGMSQSMISKVMSGQIEPGLHYVIKLLQAFDVTLEEVCKD